MERSCRAGQEPFALHRAERVQASIHRQLILLINPRAATNQQKHMLWWLFQNKQTHPRPPPPQRHMIAHLHFKQPPGSMQPCSHVDASVGGGQRLFFRPRRALTDAHFSQELRCLLRSARQELSPHTASTGLSLVMML